jgi:hypothetical protein
MNLYFVFTLLLVGIRRFFDSRVYFLFLIITVGTAIVFFLHVGIFTYTYFERKF